MNTPELIELDVDHTTPEQAQRLLALGVPRESANCALYSHEAKKSPQVRHYANYRGRGRAGQGWRWTRSKPCWTYGRLLEIMLRCYHWPKLDPCKCRTEIGLGAIMDGNTLIESIITHFERCRQDYDFTKLIKHSEK